MKFQGWVLGCLLVAASALPAYANLVKINFTYVLGPARAVGSVTLETRFITNPGANSLAVPGPAVKDIHMTVTGAATGNGTFTTSDFNQVIFDTGGGTLDLTQQLVGQPTAGNPWGTTQDGTSGDLNFFGAAPAPNGVFFFILGADGGAADGMILTSAVAGPAPGPSVPTLSQWMVFALALLLAGIGIVRVRRLRP